MMSKYYDDDDFDLDDSDMFEHDDLFDFEDDEEEDPLDVLGGDYALDLVIADVEDDLAYAIDKGDHQRAHELQDMLDSLYMDLNRKGRKYAYRSQ